MRFLKAVALAAIYCRQVTCIPASTEDLDAECGALGVMKLDKDALPPGVNPDNVRKCLGHPESLVREKDEQGPVHRDVFRRTCWKGRQYGCSYNGYCWRLCGGFIGEWCWAAEERGYGPWIRCSEDNDCGEGLPCGQGDCLACGCRCT
ncbi:uncharacterized protein MAM_01977 [Metarhizium album ARSEF 1941]|uniref:IDI-2 n=1 Tax=Metarhizium album (strain ARSEF 1941) TaxID=1081103 RepID=A0A0B2X148_METAS|nr:uncharacterized protein MAM_01977 [Metarhizium album ARSEF 1941]KHO00054.1 hypothetical protein MAM_01977 [Metarhizium album ARSEF 1941]